MLISLPPAALQGQVIALWSLRGTPLGKYSGLPKPYLELVISLSGDHSWQIDETSPWHIYREGWITPVQSGPRFAQTVGPLHLIGARLSLGAARAMFGVTSAVEFAPPIPLEDLLGSESKLLREMLAELPSDLCRMRALAQWIERRPIVCPVVTTPSEGVLAELGWRTDALADYLDISARGLRKRFNTQFGMSPKAWLQLNRFNSVLNAGPHPAGLAETAAAFGYADQAHMTKEFRRFSGLAPRNYLQTRLQTHAPEDAPHFLPNN